MQAIPVDTTRTQFLVGGETKPATTETGTQRTDAAGRPLFQVPLVALLDGLGADTLTVRLPGPVPKLEQLTPVRLTGLIARPWSINGRSGVSFVAESIAQAKATG